MVPESRDGPKPAGSALLAAWLPGLSPHLLPAAGSGAHSSLAHVTQSICSWALGEEKEPLTVWGGAMD